VIFWWPNNRSRFMPNSLSQVSFPAPAEYGVPHRSFLQAIKNINYFFFWNFLMLHP
jgi:hypothetical protein